MNTEYDHQPWQFLQDTQTFVIGGADDEVIIRTPEEARDAVLSMTRQAKRTILLFTHNLDAKLFDSDEYVEALTQFVRSSPQVEVNILIKDPKPAVQYRHRLIEVCQRLSSFVRVRRVSDEFQKAIDAFFVVDKTAFVYRKRGDTYDGVVNFNGRVKADRLVEAFTTIWEQSAPDPEFRRLHI